MINELNEKFLIPGCVQFVEGVNGMPKVMLEHSSGSSLDIYLHAAHITAWRVADQGELLFLSRNAEFKTGKAIRGGIPIIFPQFGNGEIVTHGFARNRDWVFESSKLNEKGEVCVELVLRDIEETRAIWDFKFELRLEVILGANLTTNLTLRNNSDKPFSFQSALHTYFRVGDISRTEVKGLKGLTYLDKLQNNASILESRELINFNKACDSVYLAAPDQLEIIDNSLNRKFVISKSGFNEAVVWNPWIENSVPIKDLHEDAYKEMVCVESANVQPKIELQPGNLHHASQKIELVLG